MFIFQILRDLWRLRNKDYIPPAPGGYKVDSEVIDPESRRVMARLGIRSPAGLPRALRRAGVQTVDELVAKLEHYRPRRKIRQRWRLMMDRLFGGDSVPPHTKEMRAWTRRTPASKEIERRVNHISDVMRRDKKP